MILLFFILNGFICLYLIAYVLQKQNRISEKHYALICLIISVLAVPLFLESGDWFCCGLFSVYIGIYLRMFIKAIPKVKVALFYNQSFNPDDSAKVKKMIGDCTVVMFQLEGQSNTHVYCKRWHDHLTLKAMLGLLDVFVKNKEQVVAKDLKEIASILTDARIPFQYF